MFFTSPLDPSLPGIRYINVRTSSFPATLAFAGILGLADAGLLFIRSARCKNPVRSLLAGASGWMVKTLSPHEFLCWVRDRFFPSPARTEANYEARQSEAEFRALVAATSDYTYEMSPDWSVMRHLGGRKELVGDVDIVAPDRDWLNRYFPPEAQPLMMETVRHAIRTKSNFELELRARRFDGSIGWILSRAVPMLDEHGQIVKWLGAIIDTTERKRAGEALLRNERLASLGRMAATISHEINNPLEALTNLVFLAEHTEGLPDQARDFLREADAELGRIAHITRQALGFYRESTAPGEVSVDSLVNFSVDLVKRKIADKHIYVEKQFRANPRITATGGELRQVFSNLLVNSADAVGDKGTIKMRVSDGFNRAGRRAVRVTVADNGTGIPPTSRVHIFEPLYTTKGKVGTGLGLWVARQIVEKHGGKIQMHSSVHGPRRGTTFSVLLPG